jgi:hypothetical protein
MAGADVGLVVVKLLVHVITLLILWIYLCVI